MQGQSRDRNLICCFDGIPLIPPTPALQLGTDARYVEEYVKLVTAALSLCRDGDAAAIAQLRGVALQVRPGYWMMLQS